MEAVVTESNAEKITRGEDIGVDVTAIEREFAALWRAAGDAVQEGKEKPVTRACLANLVVWAEEESMLRSLKEAFDTLVVTVPARVIVLRVEEDLPGEREFESWISANCIVAPGGGKLVCSEEVTLAARGKGVEHLNSVVRALLVPNVPTMCLVPRTPKRAMNHFKPLIPLCDRVIVDSASHTDVNDLIALGKVLRVREVVDLGWMALNSFKSALSSVFDHHDPLHQVGSPGTELEFAL